MPSALRHARPALAALWLGGLAVAAALLLRPAPAFVNLGPGDVAFTRGFRAGWEREGPRGNPHTAFRWTEDGARLELPGALRGADVRLRARLARFATEPAEVVLLAGGLEVARWTQESRGFHVREFTLGGLAGPLVLQFRSTSPDGSPLGVALDWIEVRGAALRPPAPHVAAALALLLGLPVLAGLVAGRIEAALAVGAVFAWAAAAGAWIDPLGSLLAVAAAVRPVLVTAVVVAAATAALRRAWPDQVEARAVAVPLAATALWLALVSHPGYHYPDVDTHVRMARALESNPVLLLDPTLPWARRGDVTREFGGQKVAIPYALVFHATAWPLVPWLGEAGALKAAAVAALGVTLLLVFPLARAAGLGPHAAVFAQVMSAALPVSTARVALALYPTLLGQAAFVLLLAHLARRFGHLDGARDAAAAAAFFFVSQVVYTGSIVTVSAFAAALALAQAVGGERRRVVRLASAWAVATALVLVQYAGFVPVLWRDVLPYVGAAGAAPAEAGHPLVLGLGRLGVFFDTVLPVLAVAGLAAIRPPTPHPARVLAAALACGAALAVLRFALPSLLRDAKEVEMMVAPVAVGTAAALARGCARGGAVRAGTVAAGAWALGWAGWRSALFYAERFWAAGR